MCQYDPLLEKDIIWGKTLEVNWTVTGPRDFTVIYGKGTPISDGRERISEISFTVSDNPTQEFGLLIYEGYDAGSYQFFRYEFTALIPRHRIQPTPSPTPTPTPIPPSPTPSPPSPAPPSPHCYSNDQLVMIIGVSSAVAIAVFTLMVATIGAVVIWVCGKGRQPKKPKFQYTQLQLEKPQAL